MNIFKGFELINGEKVERALNGTNTGTRMIGGVGNGAYYDEGTEEWMREGKKLTEVEVAALENAVLAEYDRLGGAIRKGNGDLVKMGCFYDFKGRKPIEKPKVITVHKVNGAVVEVGEDEEEPGDVKAARILANEEKKKKETQKKSTKKK